MFGNKILLDYLLLSDVELVYSLSHYREISKKIQQKIMIGLLLALKSKIVNTSFINKQMLKINNNPISCARFKTVSSYNSAETLVFTP